MTKVDNNKPVKNKKARRFTLIQKIGILLIISSIIYMAYSQGRIYLRKSAIENAKHEFIKDLSKNKYPKKDAPTVNNKTKENDTRKTKENNKSAKSNVDRQNISKDKNENRRLADNLERTDGNRPGYFEQKESLNDAVAYIEIEKIGLVLPIFEGTSDDALRAGVGILEDTDHPTDVKNSISVIAGHRGGYNGEQTFLNIDKLDRGDIIKVTTGQGVLNYRVVGQEIIEPTDWSKFTREKDKSKLILISCHPYPTNRQRILVKAELAD